LDWLGLRALLLLVFSHPESRASLAQPHAAHPRKGNRDFSHPQYGASLLAPPLVGHLMGCIQVAY